MSRPPSIIDAARSDPVGAGIVVCACGLIVLAAAYLVQLAGVAVPGMGWLPDLISPPRRIPRPLPPPPAAWRDGARPGDVLTVPGLPVAYWGRPDAVYGSRVTTEAARPVAIVTHFTDETPALSLVKYGHSADPSRGGNSYGYHFYVDPDGRVLQGAPLSVRTNHIKPRGAAERRPMAAHLSSANTIAVSLVGACRGRVFYGCRTETVTAPQMDAGLAVIAALRRLYGIPCAAVFGHGDLQADRQSFEGITLSRRAREAC